MTSEEAEAKPRFDMLNEDFDRLSATALEIKAQRDDLLEALTELWRWTCRNGKNAADNDATCETWGDVHAMVDCAISRGKR